MTTELDEPAALRAGAAASRRAPRAVAPPSGPVPLHAVAVVIAAWVLFLVLVFVYSMLSLLLLPFLPLFLFGPVCLLTWAHSYARDVR